MNVIFLILFLSLFIPTNYPGLIEALIALPLGILLIRHQSSHTQKTAPDTAIFVLWLLTLIILACGSFFSRSSSMSLIAFIRYLEGFTVFILAPTYSTSFETFSRRMAVFGLTSIAVFLMLISIYALGIPPYYNSFTGINGHHPIAYTIIMMTPFVVAAGIQTTLLHHIILTISLVLSAARGAWIIGIVFFTAQMIQLRPAKLRGQTLKNVRGSQPKRRLSMLAALILLLTALTSAVYIATLSDTEKEKLANAAPIFGMHIKDANAGMRMMFAGQAITALKESPILGHGPGTFALLSRQYQTRSGLFSQYAHSFPLETLAENGVIGSIGIAALFILVLYRALQSLQSGNSAPLGWAVILTVLYSIIEVNLNSLPHWLMFWLIAGALTRTTSHNRIPPFRGITLLTGIILFVFSFSFLAAQAYTAGRNTEYALMLAPYDKSVALRHIAQNPAANSTEIHRIQRWHKLDPDILMGLSRYQTGLLRLALEKDPQNTHFRKEYIARLLLHGDTPALISVLCTTSQGAADSDCPLQTSQPFSVFVKDKSPAQDALNHLTGDDGYAKFLYFLGVALYTYTGDTRSTTYLWQKAQEAAPQWGFYYLEVAGAQYYWHNDISAAEKTIALCMRHPLAAKGCKLVTDIHTLLRPGLYSRDIIIIPALQ